jgi:hypothetical protein
MRRLAVLALSTAVAVPTAVAIPSARADGETSPMLGGSLLAGASTEPSESMAGVALETAVWWHWVGLAVEASARAPVEQDAARSIVVGGSARLRVVQMLVPSLFEPSDVELAVELQGIVERTVWDGALTENEPYRRGIGIALRFRGSTEDYAPRLIAESRFFLRVMSWREPDAGMLARTTMPMTTTGEVMVLLGVGAAFGGGDPTYLRQFRRRDFESALLP